ncbi:MAG TPA: DoxX family membrane protein [Rhodanobacteraceae bacterium]|nr:DoxX family membrane protein [Rhodanobacteraceae bacterium]
MTTPAVSSRNRAGLLSWLMECLAFGPDPATVQGRELGRVLLALLLVGLGIRGCAFGDFAGVWQRIPIAHLPAQPLFVYATALVELIAGIGLLVRVTARTAAAMTTVFAMLWMVLLKFPAIIARPDIEGTWLGAGEIAVIVAGAWSLYAMLSMREDRLFAGRKGLCFARLLFVLALPTIGLSHFLYLEQTVALIPAWLPWHAAWACLTGAADIATAFAILFALWPRLAATLEAAMLWAITLIVWLPVLSGHLRDGGAWAAFLMSGAIAAGAAAMADSYRGTGWFSRIPRRG